MNITFKLNGHKVDLETDPETRLVDILRKDFHLLSVREACREGRCGSCTVQFNGTTQLACLIPAIKLNGADILTLEGINDGGVPNYLQQAFVDADAIQCGFCTSGLLMSAYHYIENGGEDDIEEIKKALSGNLCRCTGYVKVIEAVRLAIKSHSEKK